MSGKDLLKRFLLAAAITLCSVSYATAQEPLVLKYTAEIDNTGQVRLVPTTGSENSNPEASLDTLRPWSSVVGQQAWFAIYNQQNQPEAVYTVPTGGTLPPDALARVQSGGILKKVVANSAFDDLIPSTEDIKQLVERALTNTKDAACAISFRPSQFGAEVDVRAGIFVSGGLKISVTWEAEKVCGHSPG